MDVTEMLEKVPQRCKHCICIHSLYLACCVVILGSQVACQKENMLDDKNSVGLLRQPLSRRSHAAPLPLLLCACISHFVWRKTQGRWGAIGEEPMAMAELQSQAGSFTTKIYFTDCHCITSKGPTDELWIQHTKKLFVVSVRCESCRC